MSFPVWQVALVAVYAVALTTIACYLLIAGDPARRPKPDAADHDAEILAVAAEGLEAAPELADDGEAVARTVLALEEVAELRRLARQDGAEAAFVSPGHRRLDAFLDEVLDRRRR